MKLALPTLRFIVFSLVAVALCALPAAADDLVYHSGGRTFAVEKSAGEFAVELPPGTYTATRTKLASESDVTIEPLPWARDRLDHFIVRVSETVAEPVTTIRELLGVGEVSPVYRIEGYDQPVLGSGNVILRLGGGLNAIQREQFFRNFRVDVVRQLDPDNGVYVVRPQGNFEDGDIRTAAAMSGDDRTVYALPDFIVPTEPRQILEQVEDEFFDRQWHLNNVGQGQGTPGADINIEGAWEITFGEDVLVGMHDDSCDTQHEDLIGNFIGVSYDPLTGTESPSAAAPLRPNDAHGTAVMGLIAGDANDLGIRGVAPAARFTASRGVGGGLTLSQVASAFTFARQQDVDVHNNSWGSSWPNSLLQPIVDGIRTSFESGRNQRGMVILFSAGNDGRELGRNDGLATLPDVIGVAATSADDLLVSYSNYGVDIDISAPSFEFGLPGMVTADVDDDAGYASFGYNDGSGFDVFGEPDLSDFRYTQNFGGTSASCPVASGVAALVLSRNQELTAEQVRIIMLQTAVKVDPVNGAYHPITERSLFFGYGRLDATAAVEAASESVRNGLTWPEPLSAIEIRGNVITWTLGDTIREIDDDNDPDTDPIELGDRTDRTLVVETTSPFSSVNAFIPEDNEEYVVGEEPVPGIVVVQNDGSTNYTLPDGEAKRYYALFPANLTSRYGFGVTIDTDGNVEGVPGVGDGGPAITFGKPAVSIDVSPLVGESPLAVKFKGNALSNRTVESFTWDFDDGTVTEDRTLTHVYLVEEGETRRFFASFSAIDDLGNVGQRAVAIDVRGANTAADDAEQADIRIVVSLPGGAGSDVTGGTSPFSVRLDITGKLANETVESVAWDLGDGSTAQTLSVPHTYINQTGVSQTLPLTVRVTTQDANGLPVTQSATRFLTVDPESTANPLEFPADTTGDGFDQDSDSTDGADTPAGRIAPNLCGAGSPLALIGLIVFAFVRRSLR